jgi:hypothetical protein
MMPPPPLTVIIQHVGHESLSLRLLGLALAMLAISASAWLWVDILRKVFKATEEL